MEEVKIQTQHSFAEIIQRIADAAKTDGDIKLDSVQSIKRSEEFGSLGYEAQVTFLIRTTERDRA